MSNDVEQIEAKLAAYIDGELSAEERKEIEAHLRANPTHEALVADLMRHRTMIRALPRERAPLDLVEDLQGSLEREALLDEDVDARPAVLFRIFRAPQLLSAAAIVVLGAGLGTAVFFMLPPKNPQVTFTAAPQDAPVIAESESDTLGERLEVAKSTPPAMEVAIVPPPTDADRFDAGAARLTDALTATPANTPEGFGLASLAPLGNLAGENTIMLTVSAADTEQAQRDVVTYLVSNGITWSAANVSGGGSALTVAGYDVSNAVTPTTGEPAEPIIFARGMSRRLALNPDPAADVAKLEQKLTEAPPAGTGAPARPREEEVARGPEAAETTVRMRSVQAPQPGQAGQTRAAGGGGGGAALDARVAQTPTEPAKNDDAARAGAAGAPAAERGGIAGAEQRTNEAVAQDKLKELRDAQQVALAEQLPAQKPAEQPQQRQFRLEPSLGVALKSEAAKDGAASIPQARPRFFVARNLNREQVDEMARVLSRGDRQQVASVQSVSFLSKQVAAEGAPAPAAPNVGGFGGRAFYGDTSSDLQQFGASTTRPSAISSDGSGLFNRPATAPADFSFAREKAQSSLAEQSAPALMDEALKKSTSGAVTVDLNAPTTQAFSVTCVILVREAPAATPAPFAAPATPSTLPSTAPADR